MSKAVLLSGGIESIILTYDIKPSLAITIDYGQSSFDSEFKASQYVCRMLSLKHEVIDVNISNLLKKIYNNKDEWIPYRNQFIITMASMLCIKKNITQLYIGSIVEDNKFKDGCPMFIEKMNELLSFQEGKIEIIAPYINISIFDLIKKVNMPPINLMSIAHSCTESNIACGQCNSCIKYYEVFEILKNKRNGIKND